MLDTKDILETIRMISDENLDGVCRDMEYRIKGFLEKYCAMDTEALTEKRYQRFRRM